jgi:hypothetical protein
MTSETVALELEEPKVLSFPVEIELARGRADRSRPRSLPLAGRGISLGWLTFFPSDQVPGSRGATREAEGEFTVGPHAWVDASTKVVNCVTLP